MHIRINAPEHARAETVGHGDDATNALRYVVSAEKDEPLFVIRGRDALAYPILAAYAEQCSEHGLWGMQQQVSDHAARFREWQRDNAKLTNLPDPYPGWPRNPHPEWPRDGMSPDTDR